MNMSTKAIHNGNGNVVIAGDLVFAGIDEDDRSECPLAIVIEFKTKEDMRKAIESGYATFTMFEQN
jgi:hypothetical protein